MSKLTVFKNIMQKVCTWPGLFDWLCHLQFWFS